MEVTYKDAGVDVEKGYEAVKLIKKYVAETYDNNVICDLGSFGGMYDIGNGDVLISGTDGVGTKLKAAFALNKNDTVGIDCVAMCVNDVICHGARPLFFLDYIATGELIPTTVAEIVKGIAQGCKQASCAIIGGETAEMPGFYPKGEYDLAGFCVGMVKKDDIINGSTITQGQSVIGIASSGIHSNGFSLVRKLYPMDSSLKGEVGEMLLTPTKIYVKSILSLIKQVKVYGIAHITGGGFYENIPRILPKNVNAEISINSYEKLPVFEKIVKDANLSEKQAYNTFNMGIGMVVVVDKKDEEKTMEVLNANGEKAYVIGKTIAGNGEILLCK